MGLSIITPPREVWRFGTNEREALGTPLVLVAVTLGDVAALRYSTLRLQGAGAGYAVTAGKTLVITKSMFRSSTNTGSFSLGYANTDVGMSSAADGTSPIDLDGPAAAGLGIHRVAVGIGPIVLDVYFPIPAGKFPRVVLPVGVVTINCLFFGHEV